jgi:hypothetical protein
VEEMGEEHVTGQTKGLPDVRGRGWWAQQRMDHFLSNPNQANQQNIKQANREKILCGLLVSPPKSPSCILYFFLQHLHLPQPNQCKHVSESAITTIINNTEQSTKHNNQHKHKPAKVVGKLTASPKLLTSFSQSLPM